MPSALKKPAAVKRPAAAVKKWPAGALSRKKTIPDVKKRRRGDVLSPPWQELRIKEPASPSSVSSPRTEPPIPHDHRQLSIDAVTGAHLDSLTAHQAGEVVLEALSALRRTLKPDRTFSFSARDPMGGPGMIRYSLCRCTNPIIGTYELQSEIYYPLPRPAMLSKY